MQDGENEGPPRQFVRHFPGSRVFGARTIYRHVVTFGGGGGAAGHVTTSRCARTDENFSLPVNSQVSGGGGGCSGRGTPRRSAPLFARYKYYMRVVGVGHSARWQFPAPDTNCCVSYYRWPGLTMGQAACPPRPAPPQAPHRIPLVSLPLFTPSRSPDALRHSAANLANSQMRRRERDSATRARTGLKNKDQLEATVAARRTAKSASQMCVA